ncbi:unnamed protein product [Blepharisma stoltei]|uniref:Uncharacterized protein n=1 Tax=Blepharisma stoltei TaxID=1481888 RepID=A0AAU9JGR7_9CILI|nr:unnamed protein product [Blepharisma stoltei]
MFSDEINRDSLKLTSCLLKSSLVKTKKEDEAYSGIKENEELRVLLNRYDNIHQDFMYFGNTQTSELILRRFLQIKEIPGDYRAEPLLRYLIGTMQDFAFNEIETALWALYLDKIGWTDAKLSFNYLICYSAFAAKSFLNDDIKPYEAFLSQKIENFTQNFLSFQTIYENQLEVTPKEINAKLRELGSSILAPKSKPIIDYNFYVDEILSLSPPYSSVRDTANTQSQVKNEETKVEKNRKCKESLKKLGRSKEKNAGIKKKAIKNEKDGEKLRSATFESSDLLSRIDSLCFSYENSSFTPIFSPPAPNKANSLLNRLASA